MATKQSQSVQIFTRTNCIQGQVIPGTHGLFSYLNMPTESSIEVFEGHIAALHQLGRSEEAIGKLWLVKTELVAVIVDNRAGLGPTSMTRAGYTKPFPHIVRILAGGFEIHGELQTTGRFDFGSVMFEGSSPFYPLYDVRLQALLFPNARSEAPAMVFNRGMVESLSLISRAG